MYDRTSQANKWWADAAHDVREDYGKDYFMMPMRGMSNCCSNTHKN